jgi:hypothetical protein
VVELRNRFTGDARTIAVGVSLATDVLAAIAS